MSSIRSNLIMSLRTIALRKSRNSSIRCASVLLGRYAHLLSSNQTQLFNQTAIQQRQSSTLAAAAVKAKQAQRTAVSAIDDPSSPEEYVS
jgi:hypothetical protein